MEKNRKPGWNYFFVSSLNQEVAINIETNVLYTEDKTRYSPEECHLLESVHYEIPISVHLVKKTFFGEIIDL